MNKFFDFKIGSKYVDSVSYIVDCENHVLISTKFFKDDNYYKKSTPYPMLRIVDIYDIMMNEVSDMLDSKSKEE